MPSVRKVSGTDSKSTSANAIASSAVVLDLALVEATSSDSGRVAVNYGGYDIVRWRRRSRLESSRRARSWCRGTWTWLAGRA
jgi:hypothetical protein